MSRMVTVRLAFLMVILSWVGGLLLGNAAAELTRMRYFDCPDNCPAACFCTCDGDEVQLEIIEKGD